MSNIGSTGSSPIQKNQSGVPSIQVEENGQLGAINMAHLKDKFQLSKLIINIRVQGNEILKNIDDKKNEVENDLKIKQLRSRMDVINKAANKYNNKWYRKFASIFSKTVKVETLEKDIDKLNNKIKTTQQIKNSSLLFKKFNEKIMQDKNKKERGEIVPDPVGLFRIPGSEEIAKKLAKEFIQNPDINLQNYNNDDIVSAIKKCTNAANMPEEVVQRLQKTKIHKIADVGKSTEERIDAAATAIKELPPFEKEFFLNLFDLMSNVAEYSWKPTVKEGENFLNNFVTAAPFDHIFPRESIRAPSKSLLFILENYQAIREQVDKEVIL